MMNTDVAHRLFKAWIIKGRDIKTWSNYPEKHCAHGHIFRNGNRLQTAKASETTNQPARPPRNRARYETKLARSWNTARAPVASGAHGDGGREGGWQREMG